MPIRNTYRRLRMYSTWPYMVIIATHLTNLRTSGTRILERGSAILGFKPVTHFQSSSLKLAWSTRPHSIPSNFKFQYRNRSSTEECHFIAPSEPDWTTPPTPSGRREIWFAIIISGIKPLLYLVQCIIIILLLPHTYNYAHMLYCYLKPAISDDFSRKLPNTLQKSFMFSPKACELCTAHMSIHRNHDA